MWKAPYRMTRSGMGLAVVLTLGQAGACVAQEAVPESEDCAPNCQQAAVSVEPKDEDPVDLRDAETADDPIREATDSFTGGPFVDFAESAPDLSSPTFRSSRQAARILEPTGAVLATAESFRLLTVLSPSVLATCSSTRPDLPDSRIRPEEVADRVGTLTVAVFSESQVNFSFRTTDHSPEYAISVNGLQARDIQVSDDKSGELVARVLGAHIMLIRDATEFFNCTGGGDYQVTLGR